MAETDWLDRAEVLDRERCCHLVVNTEDGDPWCESCGHDICPCGQAHALVGTSVCRACIEKWRADASMGLEEFEEIRVGFEEAARALANLARDPSLGD